MIFRKVIFEILKRGIWFIMFADGDGDELLIIIDVKGREDFVLKT